MMAEERYPFLILSGTPFERGRTYGEIFRSRIEISISNYRQMFNDFNSVDWENAGRRAMEFLPFIKNYSPKMVEEMEGIAEGASLDFRDILILNSRSEIVLDSQVDGCTSFAAAPSFTLDGKTYLCQNWDWIRRQHDSLVVLQIEQHPEPSILMIAEAGIISGKGINGAGLGVGFNALTTGSGKPGVPVHMILRGILDSPRLADAVQAVSDAARASSGNFIVASAEGELIDIEASPEDFWVFYGEEGWITHTNHFLANFVPGLSRDKGKVILPDTFQRLGRINSLMTDEEGNIDLETCKVLLSDHRNHPDSICRHEDPRDPEGKQLASVYATIMDLTAGVIWFSRSNPCKGEFMPFGPVR